MSLASLLADLTFKERKYVEYRLGGMGIVASARAAGFSNPNQNGSRVENDPKVQAAMVAHMNNLAEEIGFTRREAHEMLHSAYINAATATEQIMAVRAMIDLHGIAVPKKVEVEHKHNHTHQLEYMETDELMKLAGMENLTLEGEYEVVREDQDDADSQEQLPDLRD